MSNREGFFNIYRQRVDGSPPVRLTIGTDRPSLLDVLAKAEKIQGDRVRAFVEGGPGSRR